MTGPFDRRYLLLIGIALLFVAIASVLTGQTFSGRRYGFGGIVERSEEPKRFWWNVGGYCMVGLLFIASYVYQISN